MTFEVLCLRPEADFERADAMPPQNLAVSYRAPADADVSTLMKKSQALIIPAVGPKFETSLFENTTLKLVQVTGAGVDRLNRSALEQLNIPVANVVGGSNKAVAEYAVTTASVLLRRFSWADAEIRNGNYVAFRGQMISDKLSGLDGLLVGIVGFGAIGAAVAEAFHKMGSRICFYDPVNKDPSVGKKLNARSMSLNEVLESSDVISLHLPLLPETEGLIGHDELARMKKGSILIQASRGGIVNESALAQSLESEHLGGVAVDVYSTEPPSQDNPLLQLKGDASRKLLFTPHIAGVTRQSSAYLFRSSWENIERVLVKGEAPLNRVY
jgi:phosphoglycerate dehydrogenase-like enzyme